MKNIFKMYIIAALLLSVGTSKVFADDLVASVQQKEVTVTGTVFDENSEPLPGVSVIVKGTQKGTTTDFDGNYTITVSSNSAVLEYSFMGYAVKDVTVGNQTTINVNLEPDMVGLDEVVLVGYGVQKKENLTGAVSTVDVAKTISSKATADLGRSLQGAVPGVTITYASGNLNAKPNIKLRGFGSVNGSSNPLVLIDGVEGKLEDVNPEVIENISVLKDAASTSIYGSRAAFGVILITTKKGQTGKPVVRYSNNFSISNPIFDIQHAHMEPLMDAIHVAKDRNNGAAPFAFGMGGQDWRDKSIAWEKKYGYLGSSMTSDEMVEGRDYEVINGQFYSYRSWDVFGQILNENAFAQTHNLSISGGTERIKYNIAYGFTGKEGMYKENTETLTNNSLNINLSAKVTDWATVNFRSMSYKKVYEEPFNYRAGSLGYLFYAMRWPNNFPYGTVDGNSFISPIGFLREANRNQNEYEFSRQTVEAIFDIIKSDKLNLSFTTNGSYSLKSDVLHEKGGAVPMINWWSSGNPPVFDPLYYQGSTSKDMTAYYNNKEERYSFNAFANLTDTHLDNHTFTVLAGVNAESEQYLSVYAKKPSLLDPNLPELALATGDASTNNTIEEWAVMGYFARVNYNYKNKYLLELNGRYDGSSKFPENDRYAFFPSVSAGYKISEEDFAKDILNTVGMNRLKFRASWGQIGNQDVGKYAFVSTISDTDAKWVVDSQREKTFNNPKAVSPSLTWETIETIDFGLDMGLFNDEIEIIFDVYQRKNKDMLGPGKQLPTVFGSDIPKVNSGELTTNGWELIINGKHSFSSDFAIYGTFALSDATATVTKWDNPTGILSDFYEGKDLGEIWGFETDRLFQADDFNADGTLKSGIADQDRAMYSTPFVIGAGDVKYKDLDGDGMVDKGSYTTSDHGDLKVIGNTTPRYEYSFRGGLDYKGLDFSFYLQGVGKRDYWAIGNVALADYHYDNLFDYQEDYWRPDNTDAFYPRPFASNVGSYLPNSKNVGRLTTNGVMVMKGKNNYVPQSRYLQDLSYLRLKELTLGYTIPSSFTNKYSIQKLRFYFTAYNLGEITNGFTPVDPESSNNSHSSYPFYGTNIPQSRTYSLGLQITL